MHLMVKKTCQGTTVQPSATVVPPLTTSNPYSHCTCPHACSIHNNPNNTQSSSLSCLHRIPPQKPTGCLGAYRHSINRAYHEITTHVKKTRIAAFHEHSIEIQKELSRAFIDACASDAGLNEVKQLVREGMDVDGVYVASDGTETCALHMAAFNGASVIIRYLCSPVDELFRGNGCSENDGGLCDVNVRDDNGWTACHFAAGANCVECVSILARMGASLTIEAGNGYTPYHWAERLSNKEVMKCLIDLGADERFMELRRWVVGGGESLWIWKGRFWNNTARV